MHTWLATLMKVSSRKTAILAPQSWKANRAPFLFRTPKSNSYRAGKKSSLSKEKTRKSFYLRVFIFVWPSVLALRVDAVYMAACCLFLFAYHKIRRKPGRAAQTTLSPQSDGWGSGAYPSFTSPNPASDPIKLQSGNQKSQLKCLENCACIK